MEVQLTLNSSHIQLTYYSVFHNVWLQKDCKEVKAASREHDLLISLNRRSQFKLNYVSVEY